MTIIRVAVILADNIRVDFEDRHDLFAGGDTLALDDSTVGLIEDSLRQAQEMQEFVPQGFLAGDGEKVRCYELFDSIQSL